MPLLSEQNRRQLLEIFDHELQDPVTLRFFTQKSSLLSVPAQECHTCREAGELLEEVAGLSNKLNLHVRDLVADAEEAGQLGLDKIPALVFEGKNAGKLRYFGVPAGYEFAVLVESLVDLSKGTTRLNGRTRERLRTITTPVHLKVMVTPTCPYCPLAARLAHQLATESSYITSDVIEVAEFPEIAQRYKVYGVPKIVINETASFEGALPEDQFLNKILQAGTHVVLA